MIDGKGCFKHEMLHGFTHINNYILKEWQNLVIVGWSRQKWYFMNAADMFY